MTTSETSTAKVRKTTSIVELTEERDFLLRSIDDLEREHAAGDVSDADFEELRLQYVRQAAETLRALEAAQLQRDSAIDIPGASLPVMVRFRRFLGRRRVRRTFIVVAVICVIGAVTLIAASLAGVRLAGQTGSGSVNLPAATQVKDDLTNAQVAASTGNLTQALAEYAAVLKQVPDQPEALAYRGWLERLAGIAKGSSAAVQVGDESIALAVHVAPHYADARAFEVIVLLVDEQAKTEAQSEYAAFVKAKPSATLLAAIGPQMAAAFQQAKVAVPTEIARFKTTS